MSRHLDNDHRTIRCEAYDTDGRCAGEVGTAASEPVEALELWAIQCGWDLGRDLCPLHLLTAPPAP